MSENEQFNISLKQKMVMDYLDDSINKFQGNAINFLQEFNVAALDGLQAKENALTQAYLGDRIDSLEKTLKILRKLYDLIRNLKLPEKMEQEGIEGISIKDIGQIILKDDIYASIRSGRQDDALEWLDDHGHGELIKRTIHASSLKALLKKYVKEGDLTDIPEDIFKIVPYTQAQIRGSKKGQMELDILN